MNTKQSVQATPTLAEQLRYQAADMDCECGLKLYADRCRRAANELDALNAVAEAAQAIYNEMGNRISHTAFKRR